MRYGKICVCEYVYSILMYSTCIIVIAFILQYQYGIKY